MVMEWRFFSLSASRVPSKKPCRKSPLVTPGSTSREVSAPRSLRTSMKVTKKLFTPSRSCCT
jgi:hypothetical protein